MPSTLASFVDEQGGYNPTDSLQPTPGLRQRERDPPSSLASTMIYELPVGRGKRFGTNMNRFADIAAGGWQLSNIFLMQKRHLSHRLFA